MKKIICLFVTVATICSVQTVSAWGWWTHNLIGHTADKYLEPEVKEKVEKYLGSPIVNHCTWMDKIRTPVRKKSHPDYEAYQSYRPSLVCHGMVLDGNFLPSDERAKGGKGNLLPFLEERIEDLRNYRNMTDSAVAVNLKYVIHMIQDMHCPGHIYFTDMPDCFSGPSLPAGRMFMPVYYDGKKINYHKIWDGLSIRALYPECGKDYELFRQKMDKYSAKKRAKICKGTLLDWAKDSGMRSRKIYSDVEPLDYLDRDFVLSYREMSETQAMYSAYRLAHLINEIFK